ncbi:hypothetical protein PWG71_27955 [Nocardiopsis sp. N85]|uniref:hypothetical protein n=1 Tax=Nocardiopsis sp. N85 TaxID=3029400 RepID=UPI00237F7055|nr:hypothetical protein [Nocardiopsis sp. N85]MDE3725232.1 hypothetical protein [Nocardiopsis sp. N85]
MTNQNSTYEGLRAWASGFSVDRAAVELLITHGEWLMRRDFQRYLEPYFDAEGRSLTAIHWDQVHAALDENTFPASSSAVSVLRIALSLALGTPVDLTCVVGLDATNTAAVATALVIAAQHTDRITVTLGPDLPPTRWLKEG